MSQIKKDLDKLEDQTKKTEFSNQITEIENKFNNQANEQLLEKLKKEIKKIKEKIDNDKPENPGSIV